MPRLPPRVLKIAALAVAGLLVFVLLLLAGVTIALWRGGPPERWGGIALVAMTIIQAAGMSLVGARFGTIDWVAFGVDLLGFVAFTAIALFARRIWPLWASALQLFSLATHFVRVVDIHVHPAVYWLMKSAPTFLVCAILILATILHRRRAEAQGADPSWTVWRRGRETRSSRPTIPRS